MSDSRTEEEREEVDATGSFEMKASHELEELEKQHQGLLTNISTLKEDVQKWQESIETEAKEQSQVVKALDNIRAQLRSEVETLRSEFAEIKQSIKEQMELNPHDASEIVGEKTDD